MTKISENRIAASKSKRLIGCRVTSVANAGVMHIVQNEPACRRVAWYSGRYLPACRINHIGGGRTISRFKTASSAGMEDIVLISESVLESCDDDGVGTVECGELSPCRADFALVSGFSQEQRFV
jgi:hypothetical protein